jgi:hypothetical protein
MLSDISTLTLVFILVAAFSAGFVDAIAGGGGLIQLPALLISFPDREVAEVAGTNKLGSIFGTSAAALNYRRNIKTDPKLLLAMVLPAFIGSGSGSLLATQISTEQLKVAIVVMLVAVFVYTLARPDLGKVEVLKGAAKRQRRTNYWFLRWLYWARHRNSADDCLGCSSRFRICWGISDCQSGQCCHQLCINPCLWHQRLDYVGGGPCSWYLQFGGRNHWFACCDSPWF